jgi:hypothetical protein
MLQKWGNARIEHFLLAIDNLWPIVSFAYTDCHLLSKSRFLFFVDIMKFDLWIVNVESGAAEVLYSAISRRELVKVYRFWSRRFAQGNAEFVALGWPSGQRLPMQIVCNADSVPPPST